MYLKKERRGGKSETNALRLISPLRNGIQNMASQFFESNLELNPTTMSSDSPTETPDKQEPRFRLRACNKENYNDIAAVLELFQAHYGQNHPLPKALTDSFWKEPENQLGGEEFLSLVVYLAARDRTRDRKGLI